MILKFWWKTNYTVARTSIKSKFLDSKVHKQYYNTNNYAIYKLTQPAMHLDNNSLER